MARYSIRRQRSDLLSDQHRRGYPHAGEAQPTRSSQVFHLMLGQDVLSVGQGVLRFAVCLCCEAALPTTLRGGRWRGRVWRYREHGPETRMGGAGRISHPSRHINRLKVSDCCFVMLSPSSFSSGSLIKSVSHSAQITGLLAPLRSENASI